MQKHPLHPWYHPLTGNDYHFHLFVPFVMIAFSCLPCHIQLTLSTMPHSFVSLPPHYLPTIANPLAFVLLQSPPRSSVGQSLRSGGDVITPWGKITYFGQVTKNEYSTHLLLRYSVVYSPFMGRKEMSNDLIPIPILVSYPTLLTQLYSSVIHSFFWTCCH